MSPGARARSVLITGCTDGGIGSALAIEYHRRGCRVFATVRDHPKAAHLVQLGISDIIILDVEKVDTIAAAVKTVEQALGPGVGLDILINNAGMGIGGTLLDVTIEMGKRVFDVNVWGVLAVTQAFAPLLIASGDGRVVNIGSVFGELAPAYTGLYSAAKGALKVMSNILRVELAPLNVSVTLLITGVVATKIVGNAPVHFPQDSLYDPIRENMLPVLAGGPLLEAMESPRANLQDYSRAVVTHTLRKKLSPVYWCGYLSWVSWFVTRCVPIWLTDYIQSKVAHLDTLKGMAKVKEM